MGTKITRTNGPILSIYMNIMYDIHDIPVLLPFNSLSSTIQTWQLHKLVRWEQL